MTVIQAAIPPIVTAPFVMVVAFVIFVGFNQDAVLNKVIFRVGGNVLTICHFAFFSYDLNQTLDALVTLIVVKPYRLATIKFFTNLKRKFVDGNSSTASVTDMGSGRNGAR
jgi:hypothetical protein